MQTLCLKCNTQIASFLLWALPLRDPAVEIFSMGSAQSLARPWPWLALALALTWPWPGGGPGLGNFVWHGSLSAPIGSPETWAQPWPGQAGGQGGAQALANTISLPNIHLSSEL